MPQDTEQDSTADTKPEEISQQNSQNATQDVFVTLQVPAGLQHLQQQLLSDPAFSLQQIQFLQQVTAGQDPGLAAQQVRILYLLASFPSPLPLPLPLPLPPPPLPSPFSQAKSNTFCK